jgi:hypothetical protein
MATLWDYQKQVERLVRDQRQEIINTDDIKEYINRARREVAMRAQCLVALPPISGQIISGSIVSGGSGYTNPTVVITAPDFPSGYPPFPNGAQATATATVSSGSITAVNIGYGGQGYYQPQITITDPTGSGASIAPQMSYINQFIPNQELYPFSSINLSMFPGFKSVYYIRSISVLYSNYRYSMIVPSFSTYQALLRNFPQQFDYVPFFCAQLGRGTASQLFFYPLPSQSYQIEAVCLCLPSDLTDNQSYDPLPDPFTDAVPYLALFFCYNEMQNFNIARYYQEQFDMWMKRYSTYASPGTVINRYGRSIP